MTPPLDLALLRAFHHPVASMSQPYHICVSCFMPWPCEIGQCIEEIEALREDARRESAMRGAA